jgi:2-dehydropantoate 2-reductase
MRVIIYGAGAIGGGIGGLLAVHGTEVVLIARGAHLAAINERGLELRSSAGTQMVKVPAVTGPADIDFRADDVVLLTTKSQDSAAALGELAHHATLDLPIVCAQNGVDNERQALRHFRRVYGLNVMMPATHLEPGVVTLRSWPVPGVLDLGCYPTGTDPIAESIAATLETAGFKSQAHPAIMRRKYLKLLSNLANAVDAALGSRSSHPELIDQARAEAIRVLEAANVEIGSTDEDDERRALLQPSPVNNEPSGSSSWQSLARGTGTIEADYLNGEIVLLGRLHTIPTPANEMLQRVANNLARQTAAPGSLKPTDLDGALHRP